MDQIAEHNEAMMRAFAQVLEAENALSAIKTRQAEVEFEHSRERNAAATALDAAWGEVAKLMAETGEVEAILPGAGTNYKIGWSTPRETVSVIAEGVPDEFCKIERKPKLKEIGDHLKQLRSAGASLPNWARFERGESKLGWKAIKR